MERISISLAGIAQSVEQLIRNQQVGGSIPLPSSLKEEGWRVKHAWTIFIGLLVILISPLSFSQTAASKDSFQDFLATFNQALEKNEKDKILDLCSFPRFNWEEGFGVDVKREVVAKNFEKIFSPEIRKHLKDGKYTKTSEGHRYTEWVKGNNAYSLWFNAEKDGTYKFSGLYVGPAPGVH